jgi:hypothetical protein
MGRYLPIIIIVLLMIYCVVEVAQAPPYAVRRMPRWLWATAIICLPLAGAVCWLLLGRPNGESLGTKQRKTPKAPADNIDFLRAILLAGWGLRDLVRALDRVLETLRALLIANVAEVVIRQTSQLLPRFRISLQRADSRHDV